MLWSIGVSPNYIEGGTDIDGDIFTGPILLIR